MIPDGFHVGDVIEADWVDYMGREVRCLIRIGSVKKEHLGVHVVDSTDIDNTSLIQITSHFFETEGIHWRYVDESEWLEAVLRGTYP